MLMNGKITINLPSPIQKIEHPLFDQKKVSVFIKRDDLIHPLISGNKWRKLKYNIIEAGSRDLLTFGGAFSNHIAASAAYCHYIGKRSIGIIRGEKVSPLNPTLTLAAENGMILDFISRSSYKEKSDAPFLESLSLKYKDPFIVPEGGANALGIKGCTELVKEIDLSFDYILSAVGTGATIAGIALGLQKDQKVVGISVLKGAYSLLKEIKEYVSSDNNPEDVNKAMNSIDLLHDYHFGGYAKIENELIEFMKSFYTDYAIKTDPIYSGKSLFALFDLIQKNYFKENSTIVFYHCGGLQGIEGMEKRYDFKLY